MCSNPWGVLTKGEVPGRGLATEFNNRHYSASTLSFLYVFLDILPIYFLISHSFQDSEKSETKLLWVALGEVKRKTLRYKSRDQPTEGGRQDTE